MHDDAPDSECVPAAQIAHAVWPVAPWVDHPAGQLVHEVSAAVVAPSTPVTVSA